MSDYYDTLGIPRDATAADVKKAYRRRASKAHPDKGGKTEDMAEVNKAYAVLADPAARHRYDHGDETQPVSIEKRARDGLLALFRAALEHDGNSVAEVRRVVAAHADQLRKSKLIAASKIGKLRNRRGRIKVKDGSDNLFHTLIDQQIDGLERQIAAAEEELLVNAAAAQILERYSEDDEAAPAFNWAAMKHTIPAGAWR